MPIALSRAFFGIALTLLTVRPVAAGDTFDHLQSTWSHLHDYSVTIEAHEVLGTESDDHELRYAFRKPDHARLDVVVGTKSGSTLVWTGGDSVVAYRRGLSLFKMHGNVHQKDLTSLRGNGILNPNMGDIIACFGEHRDGLHEHDGPTVDGEATDEVALTYVDVSCPNDPPSDRAVTLDVIDISKKSGLVLMRKRYEGDEVVERWQLKDYKIDADMSDSMFR
ncbi:MAG: hypothetical protein IAI50_17210 [Candidatus Eremiobacteraeota bacterium]|nr:hypothetical protein [Candidatus Eremiobacteraeota bacterium]